MKQKIQRQSGFEYNHNIDSGMKFLSHAIELSITVRPGKLSLAWSLTRFRAAVSEVLVMAVEVSVSI